MFLSNLVQKVHESAKDINLITIRSFKAVSRFQQNTTDISINDGGPPRSLGHGQAGPGLPGDGAVREILQSIRGHIRNSAPSQGRLLLLEDKYCLTCFGSF